MVSTELKNKSKKVSCNILILFVSMCMASTAMSMSPEFVPPGVSLATLKTIRSSYNSFFSSGNDTSSALDVMKDRNHIPDDDLYGSITDETTTVQLSYQYGLFNAINVGLLVPLIHSNRSSSVTLVDPSQFDFAESAGSAEASGIGDIEIITLWRPVYTDVLDFQLGLALNGDNGSHNSDDYKKMPLGSGSKELSILLKLYLYSIDSKLRLSLDMEYELTADATVKTNDGRSVTKSQENYLSAILDVGTETGSIGYGGGTQIQSSGITKLDGESLKNGYLGYSIRAFFSIGNLNLLENKVVNHPWEIRILAEKRLAGANATDLQELSIQLSTYF